MEPKIGSSRTSNLAKTLLWRITVELSEDITLANYQTEVILPHQPTQRTRTTSIMDPSLIESTSETNHGKAIGHIVGEDMPKICGTHHNTTSGGGRRLREMLKKQRNVQDKQVLLNLERVKKHECGQDPPVTFL